jgi:hypothetical protein
MTIATKLCVRCKQKDTTDFSSCRFCGTRYDAVLPVSKERSTDIGAMLRSWPALIVILLVLSFLQGPILATIAYVVTGGHIREMVNEELHKSNSRSR